MNSDTWSDDNISARKSAHRDKINFENIPSSTLNSQGSG